MNLGHFKGDAIESDTTNCSNPILLSLSHTSYLTFLITNILGILSGLVPLSNLYTVLFALRLTSLYPLANPHLPSCLTHYLTTFSHLYDHPTLSSSLINTNLSYVLKRSKYIASHYIVNGFEVAAVLVSLVLIVVKRHERFSWVLMVLSLVYCWVPNWIAAAI